MKRIHKKLLMNVDVITIILTLSIFFILLELKHPFFFLSDDNRTFYLPMFIHNYRALLNGEIPLFNFHQYLGMPHFSNIQSAIFNPLIYFSIFLSNTLSGHSFYAIDIAVISNTIIGSVGFYYLIKHFTNNRISSFFGAIIWPLSSFNIYISASWWILSGVTAYFPWMILFGIRLFRNPNFKNMILLIISRLFLFYIGHIEYFIYSMIFEFLTVILLFLSSNITVNLKSFLKKYIVSYFITFCYTLPILIPAWMQTISSAQRHSKLNFIALHFNSFNFSSWIKGLFNPFTIDNDFYQRLASESSKITFPFLSHLGYIPILLIICYLILLLNRKSFKDQIFTKVAFFITFLISFLWSFGLLAGLIYYLPILNRFRWPFKLYVFSNFYLIIASSFGFYTLLKYFNLKMKKQVLLGFLLIFICLINFYMLYTNNYVSRNYRAHTDLIPIEEPFLEELKNGRIFSLGISDTDPYSVSTLGFNYATLLNLNHFAGYDPLIPMKNYNTSLELDFNASYTKKDLPISYLRSWGVNWYILNKDPKPNELYSHYFNILSADSSLVVFAEESKRSIFYDKQSIPLIHWQKSQPSENIEFKMHTNSINIHTSNPKSESIVVNYLYNDFFKAYLNKEEKIKIEESEIGQMIIPVPEGDNEIIIKYSNPYLNYGIYVVLIISFIIFIYIAITNLKLSKHKHY